MPYPQFLFSEQFYERKCRELAGAKSELPATEGEAFGAGKPLSEILNKWHIGQFRELWKRSGCEIVSQGESILDRHLNIISEFPAAFTGRGLTLDDVTVGAIRILLRTPAPGAAQARGG